MVGEEWVSHEVWIQDFAKRVPASEAKDCSKGTSFSLGYFHVITHFVGLQFFIFKKRVCPLIK